MKPSKFKTPYNSIPEPGEIKPSELPSETVPDQTMPMRTILDRYARGIPVSATNRIPLYYGEEDLPDPEKLDLTEREELMEQYKQEKSDIEQRVAQREIDKETKRLAKEKEQRQKEQKEENKPDQDSKIS